MMAYFDKDLILFSSDPFGSHICNKYMFDEKTNRTELHNEAIKYFAVIVSPYSGLVKTQVANFLALNLPIRLIAPSHGVL